MGGRALWTTCHSMALAGVVKDLQRQVKYEIVINDQKICRYIADFVYTLVNEDGSEEKIVEDAKGRTNH
jgi:hypothetical protein